MVAPAIVLVATGDHDAYASSTLESIAARLHDLRPDLQVSLGLLNAGTQAVLTVVEALAGAGVTEIALVPLDVVSAAEYSPIVTAAKEAVLAAHHDINVVLSRPIGPATELLNILDAKMREALSRTNAVEVDALVLAAPDGGDLRGSSLLARRARQWGTHHKLPVVLAVNDLTGAATASAIASLRTQGRRHIAVGSFFLVPSPTYRAQLHAGLRAGAIAVTDPIAADPHLVELILARYAFAAMELLDADPVEQPSPEGD